MSESYCLKSCADCAREGCGGCRAGAFAWQCEIIKCCKEKNHESCESCTRGSNCPILRSREQMPEKVFAMQRREAELAVKHRSDAELLAKWIRIIFWCMIALNVVGLIEFLKEWVPAVQWVVLAGTIALNGWICWGYYHLRGIDEQFGKMAVLLFVSSTITALISAFSSETRVLTAILQCANAVVSVIVFKWRCGSLQYALSGISRDLSEKWENQWKLYKISLWLSVGGLVVCIIPLVGLLGLLAVLGGLGLLIFVSIREYVYLWQTAKVCGDYVLR